MHEHYNTNILQGKEYLEMINQAVETSPEMTETSSTNFAIKKTWAKPALGQFDIGAATQNAGILVDDGQHANGNS